MCRGLCFRLGPWPLCAGLRLVLQAAEAFGVNFKFNLTSEELTAYMLMGGFTYSVDDMVARLRRDDESSRVLEEGPQGGSKGLLEAESEWHGMLESELGLR